MQVFAGRHNGRSTTEGALRQNEEEKCQTQGSKKRLSAGWLGKPMKVNKTQIYGVGMKKNRTDPACQLILAVQV
jgi:hypothetical protein